VQQLFVQMKLSTFKKTEDRKTQTNHLNIDSSFGKKCGSGWVGGCDKFFKDSLQQNKIG
jgi:hypothetical protein